MTMDSWLRVRLPLQQVAHICCLRHRLTQAFAAKVRCCAVLCCAVPCRAVPGCAVPRRNVLCCAVPHCAAMCYADMCWAALCYAVLCCAVLCCAVLCCAVLCRAVMLIIHAPHYETRAMQLGSENLISRMPPRQPYPLPAHAASLLCLNFHSCGRAAASQPQLFGTLATCTISPIWVNL